MRKLFKTLKITSVLALILFTSIACDKDFTSIESDIEGIQNFLTSNEKYPLVAYTKTLDPVQTNNLQSNLLGAYKDGFGTSTASIISQVSLSNYNPDYGENPSLKSVTLYVPYFSTLESTDEDGNNTYVMKAMDSLFGDTPVKLSIYKSNYFLRDFDPGTEDGDLQNYYSSNNAFNSSDIEGELIAEYPAFTPSVDEHTIEELNEETNEMDIVQRIPPGIRIRLDLDEDMDDDVNVLQDVAFWENLFIPPSGGEISGLSNVNNFRDYFRGIYFKVEATDMTGEGNMILLNLSGANITLDYTNDEELEDDFEEDIRNPSEISLNFSGNIINLFDNNFTTADGNPVTGDDLLYTKGGEGSMAVIDLFGGPDVNGTDDGDGLSDNYEAFISSFKDADNNPTRLINQANLVFHVKQDMIQGDEPDRVLLYDLNNNLPIVDYFFDSSTNNSDPLNSKTNFSNILTRDESNNGITYKIRLTEHINNIIIRDSTNLKLGLVVSTNVNLIQSADILGNDAITDDFRLLNQGTVLSPKGTVLFGSTPSVPEENRLQLEIFYTEPQN